MPDVILNLLPVREEEKAAFEAAAPDAVHLYAGRRTATPEQFAQATIVMGWPRAEMLAQAPGSAGSTACGRGRINTPTRCRPQR